MLTLVTGFIDIASREGNPHRKSADNYFLYWEKFLSYFRSWNEQSEKNSSINYVIFIDKSHFERASQLAPSTATLIPLDIEKEDFYLRYYQKLKNLHNPIFGPDHVHTQKFTPLYSLVTCFKFILLERASQLFPSNPYLYWLDFGAYQKAFYLEPDFGNYLMKDLDKLISSFNPRDEKIRLMRQWTHNREFELSIYLNHFHIYSAMLFGGPQSLMKWFIRSFQDSFQQHLRLKRSVVEEKIFPSLLLTYPEKFQFFYGDYEDSNLDNLLRARKGLKHLYHHFIYILEKTNVQGSAHELGDQLLYAFLFSEGTELENDPSLRELLENQFLPRYFQMNDSHQRWKEAEEKVYQMYLTFLPSN